MRILDLFTNNNFLYQNVGDVTGMSITISKLYGQNTYITHGGTECSAMIEYMKRGDFISGKEIVGEHVGTVGLIIVQDNLLDMLSLQFDGSWPILTISHSDFIESLKMVNL